MRAIVERSRFLFRNPWLAVLFVAACSGGEVPITLVDAGTPVETGVPVIRVLAASSASAGQCVPVILALEDPTGKGTAPTVELSVQVLGVTAQEVFADDACATSLALPFAWAVGAPSRVVYLKPALTQNYSVQFAEAGSKVVGAVLALNVTSSDPDATGLKLAILGAPTIRAGQCAPYAVALLNQSGASRTRPTAATVALSGGGSGTFYAGANCAGEAVTSVPLAANAGSVAFSLRDPKEESLFLQAQLDVEGIAAGLLAVQVQASATAKPAQFSLSGPGSAAARTCSAPVQVRLLDNLGNATLATTPIPFTLSGNLGFAAFSDSSCSTALTSPVIPADASTMSFYFTVASGGTLTVTADDDGPLTDASLTVPVTATTSGSASRLAVSGPTSVVVGVCSPAFLVTTKDGANADFPVTASTTIHLTGKGAGEFYTDGNCTTAASSVVIGSGESSQAFYFKTGAAGALVFNADDSGPLLPGSAYVTALAGPPAKLTLAGSTPINLGDCRAYVVTSQDANGVASPVSAATAVNLTRQGSGLFYSDTSCTNATTAVMLNAGQTNGVFFFKSMTAGSTTLQADTGGGLASASLTVTVAALPAVRLELTRPLLRAGACQTLTVTLRDSLDGAVLASSPVAVGLSSTGSGHFHATSECGSGAVVTSVSVAAGASKAQLFYADDKAERVTLTASTPGLTSDPYDAVVAPGLPDHLVLTGAGSIAAGACVPFVVRVEDAKGNTTPVAETALLTFSGASRGRFFNNGDCTTANPTASLVAGATQGLTYFLDPVAEAVTLRAQTSGLGAAALPVSVAVGNAIKLVWTVGSPTVLAGACVTGNLQVRDALDNPVSQSTALTIALDGLGSAMVHTTPDCSGTPGSTLTLSPGLTNVGFSFRDNVAEALVVSASSAGLTVANQAFTVTPGPATKLALTGPAAVLASECTGYGLRLEDALGNAAPATSTVTVNVTGLSNAKIYTDGACTTPASSVAFAGGSSLRTIYLLDAVAENLTVNAAASGGSVAAATKSIAVSALAAVKLALTGATSAAAQACTTLQVQVLDVLGNGVAQASDLPVNLQGNGSGAFYSDSGCTTAITSVTVLAGAKTQAFRFKSNVPEALTLTAQAEGLADGVKTFTITALAPSKLVWSGVTTVSAGTCTGYLLTLQDRLDNLSPAPGGKTLVLTGAGTGSFFSDPGCTAAISSLTTSSTQASASVYFKADAAQNVTFNADDLGQPDLTAGTLAVTVKPSGGAVRTGPVKLSIAGTADVTLGSCAPFAVIAEDAQGSPAPVTEATLVTLSGHGEGTFFRDSGCSASVSSVTLAVNATIMPFYFRTAKAGSYLFMAIATGLSLDSHSVNVPAPTGSGGGGGNTYVPIKLIVTGPTDVLSSSCGGQFTVSSADAQNQLTAVDSDEVVTLTNGAGNGTFYADAGCTSAITSLTFTTGTSQQFFYFKDAQAESVSLQAYSASLIYGSLSVQVRPSGRLNLSMATSGTALWQNFIYRNRGTLSDRTIVLQNVGLTQANAVSLATPSIVGAFSFRGGLYPGLGGTCADDSVLLPNQQCTMIVRFQPTSADSFSDNVKVTYSVGSTPHEVNLPLAGAANNTLAPMAVVAGSNHTCVTLTDMSTKCFGANAKGQLGVGNTTNYGVSAQDIETLSWTPFGHFSTQIAAGAEHTCALMPDGGVVCWGDNTYGQLGTGNPNSVGSQPADLASTDYAYVNLGNGKSATKLAAGAYHTCALLQSGDVKCWGANNYGQLGLGDNVSRGRAANEMGAQLKELDFGVGQIVVDLAAGSNHSCVILKGGQLKCWGRNIFGQLGIGSTADMGDNAGEMGVGLSPVSLGSGATVLSVGAGVDHTCAILTVPSQGDPIVKCWGRNDYGQVGIGDALQRGTSPSQMGDALPIVDLGLSGVPKKLALGRVHSCVLLATGSVKCWGSNQYGQTGLSESTSSNRGDGANEMGNNLPTVVLGNSVLATDLTSGADHVCALIDTNKLRCWGRNDSGQLGHDHASSNVASWGHSSKTMANLPDSWVNNYSYYEGLALDANYTCGVSRSQNEVICWGNAGQSGSSYPTKFHDFSSVGGVKQLEAGTGFMCVLSNDGKVICWGDNGWYSDNLTSATGTYTAPNLAAPVFTGATRLAAGEGFVCAVVAGNAIKCFGHNVAGTLGPNGPWAFVTAAAPVTMTLPDSGVPSALAAGASHACAIDGAGKLSCWGANNFGQLGDGSTTPRSAPAVLTFGSAVAKVSLGRHHACVVLSTGAVQCWGDNQYGQVGVPGASSYKTPQTVTLGGPGTAKDLSLGEDSTCAVMTDDTLRCWGRNGKGELALGHTNDQATPAPTLLGEDFRIFQVRAPRRGQHRCAIGWEYERQVPFQLKCWGDNAAGQLGYNDTTNRGGTPAYTGRAILPVVQNTTATQAAFSGVPLIARHLASQVLTSPNSAPVTLYTTPLPTAIGFAGYRVKLWGGGGGGGNGNSSSGMSGGHGGFVSFDVPAAQVTGPLAVYVAGKGQHGCTYSSAYTGGSGGGSSALLIGSTLYGVAGGGGGGGGGGGNSNYCGTAGGGAGTSGTAGSCTGGGCGSYQPQGGTTSAGGTGAYNSWLSRYSGAGTGPGNGSGGAAMSYSSMYNVSSGGVGYGTGGVGSYDGWGYGGPGGGGAGYYGGAGGGFYSVSWPGWNGCGESGAGGSNWISSSATAIANNSSSNSPTAPGTSDADYVAPAAAGGVGVVSNCGADAGNGRVVIRAY